MVDKLIKNCFIIIVLLFSCYCFHSQFLLCYYYYWLLLLIIMMIKI